MVQTRFGCRLIGCVVAVTLGRATLGGVALGQDEARSVLAESVWVRPVVASPAIPTSAVGVIRAAAGRAGVIFAGQVVSIHREDLAGFVDIRFHVDQAVRGCGNGDTYVLREWAGLWSGEPPRYREGERLLMLLAPRGRGGMSAPVDGPAGVIPLLAVREQPLVGSRGVVPAETAQQQALGEGVDLRWVETLATRRTFLPHGGAKTREAMQPLPPSLASVMALLGPSRVVAYPVDR